MSGQRIVDDTVGGGAAQAAGTWRTVDVNGLGQFADGAAGAVSLSITAQDGTGSGYVQVKPEGSAETVTASSLVWNGSERVSSTAMVAVDAQTRVQVYVSQTVKLVVDLQGYFTKDGVSGSGGFVADGVGGHRVATATNRAAGSELVVDTTAAAVPDTATAVFANITVASPAGSPSGTISTYRTDVETAPITSMSFVGGKDTGLASIVNINATGKFTVKVGSAGYPSGTPSAVTIYVDIQGYYDGAQTYGAFAAAQNRVYDTRTTATTTDRVPVGTTNNTLIKVAGTGGVPSLRGAGIGALAISATVISYNTADKGGFAVWGPQSSELTAKTVSTLNYSGAMQRSDLLIVTPDPNTDSIYVSIPNGVGAAVDLVLDVVGYFGTPRNVPYPYGKNCLTSGMQSSDQMTTHPITDQATMAWNPTNGNLLLTGSLINVKGPGQNLGVGWRYNALNDARPTLTGGWAETSLRVDPNSGDVTYTTADGTCYVYKPSSSQATYPVQYTKPAHSNATLTKTDARTYSLRFNPSGATNIYSDTDNAVWRLTSSSDVTAYNSVSYDYPGNRLTTMSMNGNANRKLVFTYADQDNPGQPSKIVDQSMTPNRQVLLDYQPGGQLTKITDATGHTISFTYTAATTGSVPQVATVTDNNITDGGTGHTTSFTYEANPVPGSNNNKRVTSWTYPTVTGAAAASTFTAAYDLSTADENEKPPRPYTGLTDPRGNTAKFIMKNLATNGDTDMAVSDVKDPLGVKTTSQWSSHGDLTQRTNGLGNNTQYGRDTNNMVNKITSQSGSDSSLTFPASGNDPIGNYRPSNATDSQGNTTTYSGYDATAQQPTSIATPGNAGGTLENRYWQPPNKPQDPQCQTPGTPRVGQMCASKDAGGRWTTYQFNTAGDVIKIDRPALGDIDMTYDDAGRVITRTNGDGDTATTTYDNSDRIVRVTYNTTTCTANTATCVQYTYDNAGNLRTRADGNGTTTYTYDAQNRVTRKQTVKNGTTTLDDQVTYDEAGNLTTHTDQAGTTTYTYDTANKVVALAEPGVAACPVPSTTGTPTQTAGCTFFRYDGANRRTHTYLPNGRVNFNRYDGNGRVDYTDNRAYDDSTTRYGARYYAYTSKTGTSGGANTDGGLVSGTGTALGVVSTYYNYDQMNRLVRQGPTSSMTDTDATTYWRWDVAGNRLQQTVDVAGSSTATTTTYAAYDNANQLCWTSTVQSQCSNTAPTGATTYSHDAAGNTTGDSAGNAYSYNALDQMSGSTVGGVTDSYGYADTSSDERTKINNNTLDTGILGHTVTTTNTGTVYQFVRDPSGKLIALRFKTSGQPAYQTYYYSVDRLGSITLLTNGTNGTISYEYTYDTWGNNTNPPAATTIGGRNPYRYAGGYADTTGLIKFGTRYYNPTLGVWTQTDPAMAGPNYFTYAGGNPITNNDPSGRDWTWGDTLALGAAVVGTVATGGIGGFAGVAIGGAIASAGDFGGAILDGESGTDLIDEGVNSALSFGLGAAGEAASSVGGAVAGYADAAGQAAWTGGSEYSEYEDDGEYDWW